ncbi:MAG: glycoside hydrolase family 9 protein [Oscillospiraceae bacterium]|nr:glycoside hydrolase [Ruminococcus sp.]MBQ4346514.1 glycoside hydrolase family 9 protein [Oscillospiraceae bacterium]
MQINRKKGRIAALTLAGMLTMTAMPMQASALVTDPAGDYDNFAKALQYSLHFYDANMCGPEVTDNSRFAWRANCHTYDAAVPLIPMDMNVDLKSRVGTNLSAAFIEANYDILNTGTEDGTVDVSGGYHDAGDHVKFGLPEAYAGTTVSWGYYEFRDAYVECEQQEHVETIIRYFCDYFMRCTFRDANGDVVAFCYQVGDGDVDHEYWQLPQNDTMVRTAWFATAENPTTCNVTNTAACLAINYLNFKDTDPEYAAKCLDYAEALFAFANANDKAIADIEQGPKAYYGSSKWEDDYCFAACWLYLTTGNKQYLTDALPLVDFYAPPTYVYCWNDMWNGVILLMGMISENYKSDKSYSEAENPNGLCDLAMDYISATGKSPYEEIDFWACAAKAINTYMTGGVGTITPQGYFWLNTWGSARYNTAAQFCALVYDKYNKGKDKYNSSNADYALSAWAKGQMEYILGKNETTYLEGEGGSGSRCYLVGYDENSAAYPHHRASSGLTKCEDTDQQLYVLFGALCGGPDATDSHMDVTSNWIYNEVTIDYNAACPGAAAGLYLLYKDDYAQSITPDFPPADDGGRASSGGENGEGGTAGTWVEACGIDDLNADGAGVTKISLMVRSTSGQAPENMTVRYYIDTTELASLSNVEAKILYDQVSAEAAPAAATISAPVVWERDSQYAYIELNWGDYNFVNCGKKVQISIGFYYGDTWDPTNDPSYRDLTMFEDDGAFFGSGNEVKTDYICVYDNGVLIGGIEPDGTTVSAGSEGTDTPSNPVDGVLYGDANCDGIVKIGDVILCNRYISEDTAITITEQGLTNADCDGKAGVTSDDSVLILKLIAGMISAEELGG